MNLPKDIAASVRGVDQVRLDNYIHFRRQALFRQIASDQSETATANLRGRIAELGDLLTLSDAVEQSLSAP